MIPNFIWSAWLNDTLLFVITLFNCSISLIAESQTIDSGDIQYETDECGQMSQDISLHQYS